MTPTVALVSRWGGNCGIDDYARDLVEACGPRVTFSVFAARESSHTVRDDGRVVRDWDPDSADIDELLSDLKRANPDVVHIQFNWGAMRLAALRLLLEHLAGSGTRCVLQLHATMDQGSESLGSLAPLLKRLDCVVVHNERDVARLASWGVEGNVWRWRLGEREWPLVDRSDLKRWLKLEDHDPIVATFGFLQPRKGLLTGLEAVKILKERYGDVFFIGCCALHPRGFDADYYFKCRELASSAELVSSTALITDYLPAASAMALLQAADVTILPYVDTPEGQSAAAKFCLAAGRPVIVSSEMLFDEYRDSVLTLPEVSPRAIAEAIESVIGDPGRAESLATSARRASACLGWPAVSAEYVEAIARVIRR